MARIPFSLLKIPMWLIRDFLDGFCGPAPPTSLLLLRYAFGVSCLAKFAVETGRAIQLLRPNELSAFRVCFFQISFAALNGGVQDALHPEMARRPPGFRGHHGGPRIAVICASLFVDLHVLFKFHTCFFLLIGGALLLGRVEPLIFAAYLGPPGSSTLPHFLVAATTCCLYIFSAVQKVRSPLFRSGKALKTAVLFMNKERIQHDWGDLWYPGWIVRSGMSKEPSALILFRRLSWTVICIEVALPALLLVAPCWRYGLLLGVAFHVSATVMDPFTLFHFSFLTVASYIAFLDPYDIQLCFPL